MKIIPTFARLVSKILLEVRSSIQFFDFRKGSVKDDILSGLTVALALVPEAVAFAFVAGISPIIGLYGAFIMGLITYFWR